MLPLDIRRLLLYFLYSCWAGVNETMQQEGDPSSHEKAKRKLKTPAQLEALEKFYNEHKYPTEAMKLKFAKEIGLSEKQVSGWFCHRRLKQKKVLHSEIYTNGKQNPSSSVIHDRTSVVKQESCSSTKQVDRNFDSKEVESKMYYGCKSSFDLLAYEVHNKHAHAGHNHATKNRSSGSSESQGSYLQNSENLCSTQPTRYTFWNETNMLVCNKNTCIKSKENILNSRLSYMQNENESPVISALKWKLGRHYREDGPPLGFEFDPLPPGSFDSPVRDSNCEPYYVGDPMQHKSSSFCRSINEPRVLEKYSIEKFPSKAYEDQRSFKRTKPDFIDCNEITNLHSIQKRFTSHRNHVQYQGISIDETEKPMNQISCLNGRTNLRCFKIAGEYDSKAGYTLHQNSVVHPGYDTHDFLGEYFDNKSRSGQKKYDNICSEYWHQPRSLLKDKIIKENTKSKHCVFQQEMFINKETKTAEKLSGGEFWQQQFNGKDSEKPALQVPFTMHPFKIKSNLQQDVSGGTFSSLD